MGLDIISSDGVKHFHIGYFGFTHMRSYFVLHYGRDLYDDYQKLIEWSTRITWSDSDIPCPVNEDDFQDKIGDLSILVNHSDCDGELTPSECEKLIKVLFVDEDKIKELEVGNPKYRSNIIKQMYEFIKLVEYSADNNLELRFQ